MGEVLCRRRCSPLPAVEIRHGEVGRDVGGVEIQDVAQGQPRLIIALEFLENPSEFTAIGVTLGQQAKVGTRNGERGCGQTRSAERGDRKRGDGSDFRVPTSAFRVR